MQIKRSDIPDVLIVTPQKHDDQRGFFSETFKNQTLIDNGVNLDWVQDNQSYSRGIGVVRGLHFQAPPYAQAKLVRVIRGAILDVAVDLRAASPTFGRHVCLELSAQNWHQLLIPVGFAHGFCTLSAETEVIYKVTAPYTPQAEAGLRWDDAALGIPWPVAARDAIINARDAAWPAFNALNSPF
jgi:dTDP-4-dehydrorhamnose 3,5-epimerase